VSKDTAREQRISLWLDAGAARMARPSCIPHYTRSIVIYCSHALTCTHGLLYNNDTTIIYNVCSSGLPQVLCKSCGTPNWWHMVVQSTHIQYVAKGCRKRGREREIVRFCSRSCYAPLTTCSWALFLMHEIYPTNSHKARRITHVHSCAPWKRRGLSRSKAPLAI
jgi:hypothetical protein